MHKVKRRSFLRMGALSGLASGLSMSSRASQATISGASVKSYTRLGRTEMKVSDVSFGTFALQPGDVRLVQHAIDLGVNYFDTAEGYGNGRSEEALGRALAGGLRHEVYIATKIFTRANTSSGEMMTRLDGCLKRLQTDYIDVFFNHAVNDVATLKNPEWQKFAERAKAQGKVQYFGMSGHAGRLKECVQYAVNHDMFDVLLLATNFGDDPAFYERFTRTFDMVANQQGLQKLMAEAKNKDIGVIAMKVLRGAKLNDMRPYERQGLTYSQAACRWILNNPNVDNLIITMRNRDEVEEYLGASGSREVTDADIEILRRYAGMTDASYCHNVCNDCEGSCPYQVPMPDILRMRMYATDYGDYAVAREEYAKLEVNALACLSCNGAPCRDACSFSIPLADLCGSTHQLLS